MTKHDENIPVWLIPACFAFYLVVNIISWHFPFFWDSLLTSTISSWFYNNGWNGGIPVNDMDAGHPPLFYAYVLGWWKLLGRNLLFSHLAMLPILWIAVYQFIQLAARLFDNSILIIVATVLFCLETTILAQTTMVSYDIVLMAFYIYSLRYILDRKPIPVIIGTTILCLISLRGILGVAALLITEFAIFEFKSKKFSFVWKYLPAVLLFGLWNLWHMHISGWMLISTSESWSDQRSAAGLMNAFQNGLAIARVHLEPGRLMLYVLIGVGLVQYFLLPNKQKIRDVLIITFVPFISISLFILPFSNPILHRYFMVVFALSILLFVQLSRSWPYRKLAWVLTAVVMVSGHFWIYPAPVSMGWEASLSHLPYFKANRQMDQFLDENRIHKSQLSAHFPLDVSGDQSHLNGQAERPGEIEKMDSIQYVLHSNINNDFTAEELELLNNRCTMIHKVHNKWIFITLYDCRDQPDPSLSQNSK